MVLKTRMWFYFVYICINTLLKSMPYAKGTVEICVFCEFVLQRSNYVGIEEYIRVLIKEVDDKN